MAKAASPIRLERSLMEAATTAGKSLHRSTAEQIEYWADIGRKMVKNINPESLVALNAGFLKISLEETAPVTPDIDAVFAALNRDRDSGALQAAISTKSIRYQSSVTNPGELEQVHPDGTVIRGNFFNGEFHPA